MSNMFRSLVLVVVILLGCGKAEDAKNSNADRPQAQSAEVQNMRSPAKTGGDSAIVAAAQRAAPKPTVFAATDLAKVLNVGDLPQINGTVAQEKSAVLLQAVVPGKTGDVAEYYRKELAARGWEKVQQPGVQATEEYGSYRFQKDGHILDLSFSKYREVDTHMESAVQVVFHGNFDTRTLPIPEGKEDLYTSQTLCSYLTDRSVGDAVQWVKKALQAVGWQQFVTDEASEEPNAENRTLMFRKQGYALTVFIGINPLKKKTHLQYSVAALAHELPTPPDTAKLQFDDNRWKLRCEVPGDMKTAAAFYQKAMPAAGYKALPSEEPHDTYWNLRFGTEQGDVIMVQVFSEKGKTTKVLIDGIPAAVMAKIKEGEGKPVRSR